jgi:hypothetical protein
LFPTNEASARCGPLASPESLDFRAISAGTHPAPLPVFGSRRIQVEPRTPWVRTTLDVVDVAVGEQVEQVSGQAGQQLRRGSFPADSAGSQQSRRQLRLSGVPVEQFDVSQPGPTAFESGDDDPVDGFAQLDRGG